MTASPLIRKQRLSQEDLDRQCLEQIQTEGRVIAHMMKSGRRAFFLIGSATEMDRVTMERLIEQGLVTDLGDGLFPDTPQTFVPAGAQT